jgi:hypothetical protein
MSITVSGADATYTSVTYGDNTGTLYEFRPSSSGSITISGSLTSSDGKVWLIGGGGGGGDYNISNGGGGGGGEVINGADLSVLDAGTYDITAAFPASSGVIGNDTIINIGPTSYLTAYGGGYGSAGDSEEDGGVSIDGGSGGEGAQKY